MLDVDINSKICMYKIKDVEFSWTLTLMVDISANYHQGFLIINRETGLNNILMFESLYKWFLYINVDMS